MIQSGSLDNTSHQAYTLHLENQRLQKQKEELLMAFSQQTQRIVNLLDSNRQNQQRNKQLEEQADLNSRRMKNVEDQLQQTKQAYSALYNQLFVDKKNPPQSLMVRQMELREEINRLNCIKYHNTIARLEENLVNRRQQIQKLQRQVQQLETSLLQSTFQYQETIFQLQQQLKTNKNTTEQPQKHQVVRHNEYNIKNQCLLRELAVTNDEIENLRKTIVQERQKNSQLSMEILQLKSRQTQEDTIGHTNQLEGIISNKNANKKDNFYNETSNQVDSQTQNRKTDIQYKKYRAVASRTVEKLKLLLNAFIPCSNLYGLSFADLDQQQKTFLNNSNSKDELANSIRQLKTRNQQLNQTQRKNIQITRQFQSQKTVIDQFEASIAQKQAQIGRLTATIQVMLDRQTNEPVEQQADEPLNPQQNQQNIDQQQLQQSQQEMQEQESLRFRGNILNQALSELQSERAQLLQIIRQKDIALAQAIGQIKALRQHTNLYICKPVLPILPRSYQQHNSNIEDKNDQKQLFEVRKQLISMKEKIVSLKDLYQGQITSLQAYWHSKMNDLTLKYQKLLREVGTVQQKPSVKQRSQAKGDDICIQQQKSEMAVQQQEYSQQQQAQNDSSIHTINQLLKKYQKQFTKFVAVYETRVKQTHQNAQQISSEIDPVSQRLQRLLENSLNSSKQLQEALQARQQQTQAEKNALEQAYHRQRQTNTELQKRVEEIQSRLLALQSQQKGTGEHSEAAFLIIQNKNKELQRIRAEQAKLRVTVRELSNKLAIAMNMNEGVSLLEKQQTSALRSLLVEQDLVSLLENVLAYLQNSQ